LKEEEKKGGGFGGDKKGFDCCATMAIKTLLVAIN
jgi:hypothetical protein